MPKMNLITNNLPVANQGLKLSKTILISKIEMHPKFQSLYHIDEDTLERITNNIKENGFDASQVIHIWICHENDVEHFYLIDGYTRLQAAKNAGLESLPYFEHHFKNFEEAHRYALHVQIDRRNLQGTDLLTNIRELMGSEYIEKFHGNKNSQIAQLLGVSAKTVERAKFVSENASAEDLEEIENGETTINKKYNELKEKNKIDESTIDDISESFVNDDEEPTDELVDDERETLSDKNENPVPLFIPSENDTSETNDVDDVPDFEKKLISARQESYNEGYEDGKNEAIGEFFYKGFVYALAEIVKGKSAKTVYESIPDFSSCIIKKFELPESDEKLLENLQ